MSVWEVFWHNGLVMLVYMTLVFLVARARKRIDTVDVGWGLGFVLVAWSSFIQTGNNGLNLLVAILVSIWGLRLAGHIWQRAKGKDEDRRYKELSDKWRGNFWLRAFFSIFMLQGVLIWIISLSIDVASSDNGYSFNVLTWLGVTFWVIGFVVEALADKQLGDFLKQDNRPKVMRTDLWRYSRHPNYFGEILQWWSIGLIVLSADNGWIALTGPLLLNVIIVFVSGIPPIEKRRAKDAEFRQYQQETNRLIPLPPRNTA